MLRFFAKLAVFAAGFVFFDQAFILFRYANDNLFSRIADEKAAVAHREVFGPDHRDFDLVILGSSHGQFGIDPDQLGVRLGREAVNLAFGGGANIGLLVPVLSAYLERSASPDAVLLDIPVFALNDEPRYEDPVLSRVLTGQEPSAAASSRPGLLGLMRDFFQAPLLYSKAFRYAANIPEYARDIRGGTWTPPVFRNSGKTNLRMLSSYEGYEITALGWVKGYGSPNKAFLRYERKDFSPNPRAQKVLEEIVSVCRARDIRPVIVQVPEHYEARKYGAKYSKFTEWMRAFSDAHQAVYLDFNAEDRFPLRQDELFFDTDHLNARGGADFTARLADELGPVLASAP